MKHCPVCGDEFGLDGRTVSCATSSGRDCSYFICPQCESWTLDPSTAGDATAYSADYYGTNDRKFIAAISQMRAITWWRRARQVHRLKNGVAGAVLDIGCGDGVFLEKMRARGWHIHGTELAGTTFERASCIEEIDLAASGNRPELPWPDASMEVVTIWHVLEHIVNPYNILCECRRVLKNDGIVIVEVPNVSPWQARFFGKWWFHLDPPRHVTQFSRRGLQALMDRSGLPPVKSTGLAVEMGLYGIIQSALNRLISPRDLLFDTWWKGRFGIHWTKEFLSVLWAAILFPLAVLFFVAETAVGAGAVVKCRAEKRKKPSL